MGHIRRQGNAVAGGDQDLLSRVIGVFDPVLVYGDVRIQLLSGFRIRVPQEDLHHAARPVDDILGLAYMVMVQQPLAFLHDQVLLAVRNTRVRVRIAAVADRIQHRADFVEVPAAVVGDVPPQHQLPDQARFRFMFLPFRRGPVCVHRQGNMMGLHQIRGPLDCTVDFRSFHFNHLYC